jgi:hypothetical protein
MMGHAGGDLRDRFLDSIDPSGVITDNIDSEAEAKEILGALWNCTDVLPGGECDALELPRGSSYAMAVRSIRRDIRTRAIRFKKP